MGFGSESAYAFTGYGAGTGESPYLITNCEELQEINDDVDAEYMLVQDIDCSDTATWNSGAGFVPLGDPFTVGGFSGQFDGNGFEISNVYINRGASNNIGLFGYIEGGGVEDLGLVNPDITGNISVGGIAGNIAENTDIRWVFVSGGSVHANFTQAGGIVGRMRASTITNSYSSAAVTSDGDDTGGINSITEDGATVVDSFWDTEASGQATSSGGGTGRTTAQMKTQSTYTDDGWDFEYEWDIDEFRNNGYPFLQRYTSGEDYNGDGIDDGFQYSLSSYINSITGKRIIIDVGENCEITTDDLSEETDFEEQDAEWDYENGLFDFAGDCTTPGFTTTVKMYLFDVLPEDEVVRKYNPNTNEYFEIEGATVGTEVIDGGEGPDETVTVFSYDITDGGELDMDGEENGEFSDPAGLASFVGSTDSNSGSENNSDSRSGTTLAETGANQQILIGASVLLLVLSSLVMTSRLSQEL